MIFFTDSFFRFIALNNERFFKIIFVLYKEEKRKIYLELLFYIFYFDILSTVRFNKMC